jgi:dual-specificity kinase
MSAKKKRPTSFTATHRNIDEDGHLIFNVGQSLTPRYKILKQIGEGTFGKVLQCCDRENNTTCAIKVIRAIYKYYQAAKIEINILADIKRHDINNRSHTVRMIDSFDFEGQCCVVFEELGLSLYEFLKKNEYRGYSLASIREYAIQLLEGIECLGLFLLTNIYLDMHNTLHLIHTDLKPENILFVSKEFRTVEVANV